MWIDRNMTRSLQLWFQTPNWSPQSERVTQVDSNRDHPNLTQIGITPSWPKLESPRLTQLGITPSWPKLGLPQVDPNWDHPNLIQIWKTPSWPKLTSTKVDPNLDHSLLNQNLDHPTELMLIQWTGHLWWNMFSFNL